MIERDPMVEISVGKDLTAQIDPKFDQELEMPDCAIGWPRFESITIGRSELI